MEVLIDKLRSGGHSLVVRNKDGISCHDGRGVSDLFRLLKESPETMDGAWVADRVIGKGAAALMIAGGVARVHALTISRPALSLFMSVGVYVTYDNLVDNIINRKGEGICPVESLCMDCTSAQECIPLIGSFLESLKNDNKQIKL